MKSNILLIHCHDVGANLGCYGNASATTPHIDQVARDGVLCERYFATAPTCSPSRATIQTGLMPHRHGLMGLASGGYWELDPKRPTLPRLLREAGYATASFGVWHISGEIWGYGIDAGNQQATCETVAANVVEYLQQRAADAPPFFVLAGFDQPHRPYSELWPDLPAADSLYVPPYLLDTAEIREDFRRFYGDVSRADAAVGRIVDYLQHAGLAATTLLILTSDHGIAMPLAKGTLYDPGLHIPLIMRWPEQLPRNSRTSALLSNTDLLPTVLAAAGEAERIPPGLDGLNLWLHLTCGEAIARPAIFAEQTWHDFYEPIRAIRTQQHKLIRNFHPGVGLQLASDILRSPSGKAMAETARNWSRPAYELYDLSRDPLERNNLIGSPDAADIETQLRAQLDQWLHDTNDPILDGAIAAPPGYWAHFWAKKSGPGGLPRAEGRDNWIEVRWAPGMVKPNRVTSDE
ncbi:MAG: sulfatase [Chloroflexales bacterium]|nr:sulfatase [Chloroflexales bacterium]